MGIKQLSLEDVTATLQVPIPGIPGAYGELELSAEGTATIALGAEVPVPFLDDAINGEIQLEIDKEGEIAYGVEINLVGLQLEAMVRGCDIVVNVGYGPLETEAVFPIPDCEPPPEEPELPPPEFSDEPVEEETTEPPTLPDLPDDTLVAALVFYRVETNDFIKTLNRVSQNSGGGNDTYSSTEKRVKKTKKSVTMWDFSSRTEIISESGISSYSFQDSEGENIFNSYPIENKTGWVQNVSLGGYWSDIFSLPGDTTPVYYVQWPYREDFNGNSLGTPIPLQKPGFSPSKDWVFLGTMLELKLAIATYPQHYLSYKRKRTITRQITEDVYISGSRIRYLTSSYRNGELVESPVPLGEGTWGWLSTRNENSTSKLSETREVEIVVIELGKETKPPLRGEPPMSDCCAKTLKKLAKLEKELKEIRKEFTNPDGLVKEIHTVIAPAEFTEKILPPKYDEEGELVKPGNGAVTLPDVLQEIGQSGDSTTFDPEIAKIDNSNIPISWTENKPPIKQELPGEPVSAEWVYREMFALLHEIRYALDPFDVKQSEIPSRFIYPSVSKGYEKIRNYPEMFKNLFLMLDKVGFQPFQVQVDDVNPAVEGNQSETQQYHSMGTAFESVLKYLIDIEGDQDAHTSFLVRLAYEVILLHQISAVTQQTVSNIQDFLGYELRKKKESIPMAFNPLADNPANRDKVDENTEESIEKLLPNLLQNGFSETTVDEYVGRKDLVDFLFEIFNAARQKPKGNRLG